MDSIDRHFCFDRFFQFVGDQKAVVCASYTENIRKGEIGVNPTPMEALLTQLGTIATQIFSWVATVGSTIVGTPLLLLTTGFLVVGGAIGIFGRLLSKN